MASGSTPSSNFDQDTPLDEDFSSSENSNEENRARPKGLAQAIASRIAEHEQRSKKNQDRRPITRSIASPSVPKSQATGVKRRRKVSSPNSGNTSSGSATAPSMDSCPSLGMFPPGTFKSDVHLKLWSTVQHPDKPMGYPSLLYGILVAQHPDIRRPDEVFEGPARYVVITAKLRNTKQRVNDIPVDDVEDPVPEEAEDGATDPTNANLSPVVPDPHHRIIEELQKEASYLTRSIRAATSRLDRIESLIHDLSKADVPADG